MAASRTGTVCRLLSAVLWRLRFEPDRAADQQSRPTNPIENAAAIWGPVTSANPAKSRPRQLIRLVAKGAAIKRPL
jgi:hypothetical protein